MGINVHRPNYVHNIKLNINELVLHGFSPLDRYRIGRAVELELTRLLTERGLPSSLSKGGEFASIDGGTFSFASNSGAEAIGSQVARSVYEGLKI